MMLTVQQNEMDLIAHDLFKSPILCCAERGAGKSEGLKSLVKYIKEKYTREDGNRRVVFKCFDPSLSWWISSPLEHKLRVNEYSIRKDKIHNLNDIVFATGELTIDDRKAFIASVINIDYATRYRHIIKYGPSVLQTQPLIVYIVEEAQVVLNSYALRSSSKVSDIIKDFISIGRNIGYNEHGLTMIGSTQRASEVSTEVVERCHLLLGKQKGDNNLRKIRRSTNKYVYDLIRQLPLYNFIYYNGQVTQPFQFPRYIPKIIKVEQKRRKKGILHRIFG